MKKIVLAAMVMCTAVVAQAASTFTFSFGASECGSGSDASKYALYYIVDGDRSKDELIAYFEKSSVESFKNEVIAVTLLEEGGVEIEESLVTLSGQQSLEFEYSSLEWNDFVSSSYGVAVYDNDKFMVASPGFAWGDCVGYVDTDTKEWYSFATTPGPIPEPTSGMLMLLGLAGLALKRKRE